MLHSAGKCKGAGASFASPSGRSAESSQAKRSALSRAEREQSFDQGFGAPSATGAANHGGIWPWATTRLIVFARSSTSAGSSSAKGAMPPA